MFSKMSCVFFLVLLSLSFSLSAFAINLNTATVDELTESLVGVGPKLAQRIVQYREDNGLFESVEQLMEVSGIGSKVYESNIESLTLEELEELIVE